MPDYNSNKIVDILLVLGDCRGNYHRTAALYQRFPRRRYYLKRRVEFCRWSNTGQLNRHNCHYWSEENSRWFRQVAHQHRWSLNVWSGILNGYLEGSSFFYGTLNGQNYLQFLRNDLPHYLPNSKLSALCRHSALMPAHKCAGIFAVIQVRFANSCPMLNIEPTLAISRQTDCH
ncbi:hypothetical protein ALC60_07098 [Trachymyrmex zeteki]|uniref:DUF4817 domain-containing protein n=1 Tax=Mycetomoellerius zeteki TaxID=64791 RepID=A0A151X0T7_9HYME|nr:hypothetical protein ALC60_07098 [Trachymyrmex zeteki]